MADLPYPETLPDFQRMFPDEAACAAYLFALRWPEGFVCPKCEATEYYPVPSRRLVQCAACGEQTYLTAGTIMHKTHTPLLTWFYGAFLVTTLTPGISGVQFQKQCFSGCFLCSDGVTSSRGPTAIVGPPGAGEGHGEGGAALWRQVRHQEGARHV